MNNDRECVHIKASCIHPYCKCSECPVTDLICNEFYACINRCYEEAYADGCMSGMDAEFYQALCVKGKDMVLTSYAEMLNGNKYNDSDKVVALHDACEIFIRVFDTLKEDFEQLKEQRNE